MQAPFLQTLLCLLAGIAVIIVLTAKYKIHAFFALLIACFIVGPGIGLSLNQVVADIKEGFGNIMKSLGLIIVLGTTLGVVLEHSGSTRVMANYILKTVGERRATVAMSLTGFIVGLPIFCDSGFIVLSGLNRSIAKRIHISMPLMAGALATGLYSIHCLIPPHPGAAAAATLLGVDFGRLIMAGIFVAVPTAIAGFLWTQFAGKKIEERVEKTTVLPQDPKANTSQPSVVNAFLPVAVPIVLIAIKSFFTIDSAISHGWSGIFLSLGDPVIALLIGVVLAFTGCSALNSTTVGNLLQDSVEKAGGILIIIGAGGAFGAILAAAKAGEQLSVALPLKTLGILFPFLLTFLLKTAQGSSTVAIITASSIVKPLLPAIGLASGNGPMLCVLSMGAGSMMISHANDAYFWVIARFSGLNMSTMLKVYSAATIFMGLTAYSTVYLLSLLLK